jgi:hypothetical protein
LQRNSGFPTSPYTVEDLSWLLDIEDRCAELKEDKIQSFATTVARARLAGKTKTDPELQLEVLRAFHRDKVSKEREIAEVRRDVDELKRAHAEERSLRIATENAYVPIRARQIRRNARLRLAGAVLLHLLGVATATVAGFVVVSRYPQLGTTGKLIISALILLLPGSGALYRIKDVYWSTYRRSVEQAEKTVRDELRAVPIQRSQGNLPGSPSSDSASRTFVGP